MMTAHPVAGLADDDLRAMTERFFEAQCLKDETMAESIAAAIAEAPDPVPLVVHVNGAFHSDYGDGAPARTLRRLPEADVRTVSIIPVDDLDSVSPDAERGRADFLVFTDGRPRAQASAEPD
jgi:uncharacterized iron-regulated protein